MVSGVEIAGLVLGTFPIVQHAISIHQEALNDRDVRALKRSIEAQHTIFLNSIEEIISPHLNDADCRDLLDQPTGEGWKNPKLHHDLRVRLGASYNIFIEAVKDIHDMITKLNAEIEIQPLTPLDKGQRLRKTARKLKSFATRPRHKDGLEKLRARNEEFRSLTSQSLRLGPLRQVQASAKVARNLEQIRDRAKGVYDALNLGYCCEREHCHLANLRLEFRRGSARELAYDSDGRGLRFKFLFCYAPTDESTSLSGWREAELKPLDDKADDPIASDLVAEPSVGVRKPSATRNDAISQAGLAAPMASRPEDAQSMKLKDMPPKGGLTGLRNPQSPVQASLKAAKVVAFRDIDYAGTGRISEDLGKTAIEHGQTQLAPIQNLCELIWNLQKSSSSRDDCLGYLQDQQGRRYGLYNVKKQEEWSTWPAYLTNLFSPGAKDTVSELREASSKMSERLRLALTLSWNVLQLHSTPWLAQTWAKDDILLLFGSKQHNNTITLQPCISRRFESSARVSSCSSNAPSLTANAKERLTSWVKNEMLFTLGLILIELGYQNSIEKLALPSEKKADVLFTPILTASRLLKEIHQVAGSRYAHAVDGCLNFDFGDSQEAKFQVEFIKHVVGPLEEAYHSFIHEPSPRPSPTT